MEFKSFKEFYPYYLSEHQHRLCRRLHVLGLLSVFSLLLFILLTRRWSLAIFLPVIGYGAAWLGHYLFEKNRPATFRYPLWSFMGDFVMLKDALLGRISW